MYQRAQLTKLFNAVDALSAYDLGSFPDELAAEIQALIAESSAVQDQEKQLNLVAVDTKVGTSMYAFLGPAGKSFDYATVRDHLATLGDPALACAERPDAEEFGSVVVVTEGAIGNYDGLVLRGGA